MDPDLTEASMMTLVSRNAQEVMKTDDPDEMKKTLETGKQLNMQLARQDSSLDVTLDIVLEVVRPQE